MPFRVPPLKGYVEGAINPANVVREDPGSLDAKRSKPQTMADLRKNMGFPAMSAPDREAAEDTLTRSF